MEVVPRNVRGFEEMRLWGRPLLLGSWDFQILGCLYYYYFTIPWFIFFSHEKQISYHELRLLDLQDLPY